MSTSIAWSPGAAGPLLARDRADLSWQDQGRCTETDPEAFFPEKGGSLAAAKRICFACEVRAACLEYALEAGELFGVWGGTTEGQRRRLRLEAAAAGPRMCRSRRHVLEGDNVGPDGRCLACKQEYEQSHRAHGRVAA